MTHPAAASPPLTRRALLKSLAAGGFGVAALRLCPAVDHGRQPATEETPPVLPPNTPRPAAVERVRQPLLRLDGVWSFHSDAPDDLGDADFVPGAAGWRVRAVPGEWAMQGSRVEAGHSAAYWREFERPADWEGMACKLRFDSVHASCRVWVNGVAVGGHEGGFEEFELDVTGAVKPGRNTIAVAVRGDGEADMLAYASRYAAHPIGGITRKVTLFAVPPVHVAGLDMRTSRGARGAWNLHVHAEVVNAGSRPCPGGVLELALAGTRLADVTFGALPPSARIVLSRMATLPDVKAWDCEHPRLHELRIDCRPGESPRSSVVRRVGFREVSVRGAELIVNGRPVKLRGINRHEIHPERGRAAVADLARGDVELFRAANINLIRTSHYPPPEELLDACDELGMFVDCEAALCWVGMRSRPEWKEGDASADSWYPPLLRANLANLAAHRHHPSVILWSLANESAWTGNFARVNAWMQRIDPTRPTIFHSGGVRGQGAADIANCHYPRPDELGRVLIADGRPVFVGEHAHTQAYNRAEIAADPGVREHWGRTLEETAVTLFDTPHLLGAAIWAGIDDLFHLPEGSSVGYGEWGIVDVHRRHKPEYWHVKKAFSPVRVTARALPVPFQGGPLRVPVWNRSDFSDLGEFVIRWRVGERTGSAHASVPPRARGELVLPREAVPAPGTALQLEFVDSRGVLVDEEVLAVGAPAATPAHPSFPEVREIAGSPDGRVGEWEFRTDPATGWVAFLHSGELVMTAAELMLLPLEEMKRSTTNDYRPDIPPLHHVCAGRKLTTIDCLKSRGGAGVRVGLEWREAAGRMDILLGNDGQLGIQGRFRMREGITARQCGLVFRLPSRFSRLAWDRKGLWSSYPSDHIGRPEGEAPVRGSDAAGVPQDPKDVPWSHGWGALGLHDFCATRTNVNWAKLTAEDGTAVMIHGGGRQAVRAWLEADGRIGVLVADFSGGGNEPDFAHFARGFRPLNPGDELELSAWLTLSHSQSVR